MDASLLDDCEAAAGAKGKSPLVTLSWRDVDAFVTDDSAAATAQLKQVCHGISGDARPGELLALMGPSGAGKTTLLNILADRPALGAKGRWSGTVMINGRPAPPAWKRSVAYSMQKDIFFEKLTVGEHLTCTAACKLPADWSSERKEAHLKALAALLGLDRKWNTAVGSDTERGLSGGELKRLNIATELLGRPRILFMDEPFTGLDSTLARTVLSTVREIAQADGVTVLLTVHQPSAPMWSAFDQIMLLAPGGKVAFGPGSRDAAALHFDALSLSCPREWSPADHYIEIVTDEGWRQRAVEAWAARPPLATPSVEGAETLRVHSPTPFLVAVRALLRRQLRQVRRVQLRPTEWVLTIVLGLIFGLLWFRVGAHRDEPSHQYDYISIIFFFVAQWSWAPLFAVLGTLPAERDVRPMRASSLVCPARLHALSSPHDDRHSTPIASSLGLTVHPSCGHVLPVARSCLPSSACSRIHRICICISSPGPHSGACFRLVLDRGMVLLAVLCGAAAFMAAARRVLQRLLPSSRAATHVSAYALWHHDAHRRSRQGHWYPHHRALPGP